MTHLQRHFNVFKNLFPLPNQLGNGTLANFFATVDKKPNSVQVKILEYCVKLLVAVWLKFPADDVKKINSLREDSCIVT